MNYKTALGTVLLWAAIFGAGGTLLGGLIGTLAPGYYRAVFRYGSSPDFEPLQVGIGLGATQGIVTGIALSIAIIVFLAWRDTRGGKPLPKTIPSETAGDRPGIAVHTIWLIITLACVLFFSVGAFNLGTTVGYMRRDDFLGNQKIQKIEAVLRKDGYTNLRIEYGRNKNRLFVVGEVESAERRESLHKRLATAFGEDEGNTMIDGVTVANSK